jgi:hypothetical protein
MSLSHNPFKEPGEHKAPKDVKISQTYDPHPTHYKTGYEFFKNKNFQKFNKSPVNAVINVTKSLEAKKG